MKKLNLSLMILLLVTSGCFGSESHGLFTQVLSAHVHAGLVDYKSLRSDKRLVEYCDKLAASNPATIASEKARLAFWINAYNAYTLKIIVDHYPVKSINDLHGGGLVLGSVFKTTVWDKELVTIDGKKTTLNWIEHKMIRPVFKDPRAHFALVCASRSCPPLRAEAYEAEKLDAQLDQQARLFLGDSNRNSIDLTAKRAYLSKIFDWYSKDFGASPEHVLTAIAKFLPSPIGNSITSNPGAWKIQYQHYDWTLNETSNR